MRNIRTLLCLALVASTATAQRSPSHPLDITDADMGKLPQFIEHWLQDQVRPGNVSAIDDQFYISRVRPLARIKEGDYQVNPDVNPQRRMMLWVPMDDPTVRWKSLPRYCFEGDNFSMWSYIDVHGNWTSPWIRSAAGLTDVAAKNGVAVGCVLSIPYAQRISVGSNYGHSAIFTALLKKDENGTFKYALPLVKMMKYYGINGLGCNSEFYSNSNSMKTITDFFVECHKQAQKIGWDFRVQWYDGTNDGGSISFDQGLGNHNAKLFGDKEHIATTEMFANYNWYDSTLRRSVQKAKELGRSSFDYFAGFDIQGRGLKNSSWGALLHNDISIGFWGAHAQSLIHQSATDDGTSDIAIQKAYLLKQELLFSGGNHNPGLLPSINTSCTLGNASLAGANGFHGIAKFISAKSTIQKIPFVSRFNLGNGLAFRNQGEITFNHKWYNINTQDFMPTWRWWITDANDQVTLSDLPHFVKVGLSFDDAYFGGSCLALEGATTFSRVKLFKTMLEVQPNYELSIVYKTEGGVEPHTKLFVALSNDVKKYKEIDLPATTKADQWTTYTVKVSELGLNAGDKVAMLGLLVENTPENYKMYVGEMALRNPEQHFNAVTPTIDEVEILRGRYNALDFKMRYHSADDSWEHKVYNDDVDTWYYEIYAQQEEGKPQLLTATTSWAAYVVDAPIVPGYEHRKVRFGVRAVSPDGRQYSDLSWTEWKEVPYNDPIADVISDKPIIKPNEKFNMKYLDDMAAPAQEWKIVDPANNEVVASATNSNKCEAQINKVGLYDLMVKDSNGKVTWTRGKVQITPEETGAVPYIDTIKSDVNQAQAKQAVTLNYVGRLGEGKVSRALKIQDPQMFMIPGEVQKGKVYSYALWFKVDKFSHDKQGTNLINKNTISDRWPHNNWGDLWVTIRPEWENHAANEISFNTMGWTRHDIPNEKVMTTGYSVTPGIWYHVVVTQDKTNLQKIYFNGKKISQIRFNESTRREDLGQSDARINTSVVANIFIGGGGVYKAGFNGCIDEVQVWDKALTNNEVLEAMKGYAPERVPEHLRAYYTFETLEKDGTFRNLGHAEGATVGKVVAMENSGGEKTETASYVQKKADNNQLGMPGITGSLVVKTKVNWDVPSAKIVSQEGNAAVVTFATEGKKSGKLTLENGWGKAEKSFKDIVDIQVPVGIHHVNNNVECSVYPNPFVESVNIRFSQEGLYTLNILNVAGHKLQSTQVSVYAEQVANIAIQAPAGMYLVQVLKDNCVVKTLKVIKK